MTTVANREIPELKANPSQAYQDKNPQKSPTELSLSTKDSLSSVKNSERASSTPSLTLKAAESLQDWERCLGTKDSDSVIAIASAVLIQQAKLSSDFFHTMWETDSKNMMAAVNMAPLIAKAVIASSIEQSNATSNNASEALVSGCISGGMAVVTLGIGAGQALNEGYLSSDLAPNAEHTPVSNPEIPDENLAPTEINENGEPDEGSSSNQNRDTSNSSTPEERKKIAELEKLNNDNQTASKKASTGWEKFKGGAKKAMTTGMESFTKSYAVGQTTSQFANAGTSFARYHYQTNVALNQRKQGQADATSKELEQFAQFYNQVFSRGETVKDNCQQGVDSAMSILRNIVDGITQRVSAAMQV